MSLVTAFREGLEYRSNSRSKHPFGSRSVNAEAEKFQKSAEFELFSPFGAFFV